MFEKCVNCKKLGVECHPNIYVMGIVQLREFLRLLKNAKNMTNAEVAVKSGVSKGTVDSFFWEGGSRDVNYSTLSPIMCALLGDTEEMSCPPSAETESHEELMEQIRVHVAGLDSLLAWRKQVIIFLVAVVCVLMAVIITALVIDWMDKSVGFFWLDK